MFRLAHISDVHLSPLPPVSPGQLANKRILGYLNWVRNRKHDLTEGYLENLTAFLKEKAPDHIVVSGDLTNLALPDEIENAFQFLEGLGDAQEVSAVCGNHDAYVPGAVRSAIQRWSPFMMDDGRSESDLLDFPKLRIRGDVALVLCNSAEASGPYMATGYFRRRQAERLSTILEETKHLFRVIVIHHPPIQGATLWHKRLVGTGLFQEIIKQYGADLVLHGHTHLHTLSYIDGPQGRNVPVYGVAAASQGHGGQKPEGRFNLFSIEKNENGFELTHQAWGLDSGLSPAQHIVVPT